MEKKNDKKFNWKKAAIIGGIFAAGVEKVFISITDKLTGKTFGTTWKPETAKEIGETIIQHAEEAATNG